MAAKGQVITTRETGALFSPIYRPWMRNLGAVEIKGRTDQVEICELVWRADDSATLVGQQRRAEHQGVLELKLKYRGSEVVRRREKDAVVIGREPDCGLVVDDDQVSRHHCTIERRGDKFVLSDTSSNGTYVTHPGRKEVLLQREELTLSKRGWIAFGQPARRGEEAVEFICYTEGAASVALDLCRSLRRGDQADPEAAYQRLHRATLSQNVPEMMLYASEERRAELLTYAGDPVRLQLVSSMMPRVYTVRSLATSPDGTRRACAPPAAYTFMGSNAPTFGVIDMVREADGWKVDKFEWTGDKPAGFDAAVAQAPVRRGRDRCHGEARAVEAPAAEQAGSLPAEQAVPASAPAVASPPPGMVERPRTARRARSSR